MQAVQDLFHVVACRARNSMDGDWHALWTLIFQEIHPGVARALLLHELHVWYYKIKPSPVFANGMAGVWSYDKVRE